MASDKKRVQKYCKIYNWIKDNDEEFADVMDQLCLDRIADTSPKHPSITFLMPKGKLRDKIIELAYSNSPEEAVNMIVSLVLPYGYSSVEDFERASSTKKVGNKLKYLFPEITKTGKNSVNFGNKLEISLVKKFVPRDKLRIYVWQIDSGEPPNNYNKYVELQEYKLPDFSKKPNAKKVSGGAKDSILYDNIITVDKDRKSRLDFAKKIEDMVINQINKKAIDPLEIYRPFVTELLTIVFQFHKNTSIKIRPLLDIEPMITFYLIVEPYKVVGDYVVCSDVFNSTLFSTILNQVFGSGIDPNTYLKKYKSVLDDYNFNDNSSVFTKPMDIIELSNYIRNKLLTENDSTTLPTEIIKIYNTLESDNEMTIDNETIGNIFPKSLYEHYKLNHNKKLWQDEYRFIMYRCIKNIKSEFAPYRLPIYQELINNISTEFRGNDYSSELCVMNNFSKTSSLNTCIKDKIKMMQLFVSCSSFLYIGCRTELVCHITSPLEERNRQMDEIDKLTNARPSTTNKLSSKIKQHMIKSIKDAYLTDNSGSGSDSGSDNDTKKNEQNKKYTKSASDIINPDSSALNVKSMK